MTAEQLAEKFHNLYEELAPEYGCETRKADVPAKNKCLMIAVCEHLLATCQELSIEDLTARFFAVKQERDNLRHAAKMLYQSSRLEPVGKDGKDCWLVGAIQLESLRKMIAAGE